MFHHLKNKLRDWLNPKMSKISIVTAYYNRKDLFINTLNSLKFTKHEDFEFIVVDDGSIEEERVEDLVEIYPFLKIIRVEPEDKWYVNPCIPYNVGMKAATGDIIMLQNPECYHVGDLLTHVNTFLKERSYLSYSCYSLDQEKTDLISKIDYSKDTKPQVASIMANVPNEIITACGSLGWYNHPTFRPTAFHFACAMFKKDMDELGGFDERYAHGIAYDDNEIVIRIKRSGMNVEIMQSPIVLHQWHYHPKSWAKMDSSRPTLERKNAEILNNCTIKETTWRANQ